MKPPYISISRKGTWEECQQRYKYRYVLKIESPEKEPYYFTFGKIAHKIAESYVNEGGLISLKEITNSVLHGDIELEEGVKVTEPLPSPYAKRLPEIIRSVNTFTEKIGFEGNTELSFELDLQPPNKKLIRGVIDRLILKNGIYFIVDYKTTKKGRWRKTPITIKKDLQLRAYTWAIHKKFNIPVDKIRSALYYLEGGNLIPTKFTKISIDVAVNELVETYDEISTTDPNKIMGNTGEHCRRCDYRNMCPFLRITK